MIEYLIQIPGPLFLQYYILVSVAIILIIYLYVTNDYTSAGKIPEPTSLKPLEIALLRKGIRGALVFSILQLFRKKAFDIKIYNNSKLSLIQQLPCDTSDLTDAELILYKYTSEKPKYYRHFYSPGILKAFDKALKPNILKLQKFNLSPDKKVISRRLEGLILGVIIIESLGGIKLFFGLLREKPVGYLLFLMILFSLILFLLCNPKNVKQSALGRKFLRHSKKRFQWLTSKNNKISLSTDENLWYTIATFGVLKSIRKDIGNELEIPYKIEERTYSSFLYSNRESSYHKGCAGCAGGSSKTKSSSNWWVGTGGCGSGCSSGCGSGCGGCGGCGGD